MDRFSKLHPIFHFLYFIGMFALIVSVYNPFFILVSLLGALQGQGSVVITQIFRGDDIGYRVVQYALCTLRNDGVVQNRRHRIYT